MTGHSKGRVGAEGMRWPILLGGGPWWSQENESDLESRTAGLGHTTINDKAMNLNETYHHSSAISSHLILRSPKTPIVCERCIVISGMREKQ